MGIRISNYTTEAGLSQNNVTCLLKEESGFIWATTLDGLSRFDGYDFKNFKADSKELSRSISNQFIDIKQDQFRHLWLLNDIGQVLRFDPKKETFTLYPSADRNKGDNYFAASEIIQLSPTELWILSSNDNGALQIMVDSTEEAHIIHVGRGTAEDQGTKVNNVFMERNGQRWLLTKQGAATISQQDTSIILNDIPLSDSLSAFQMIETDQELLIAASQGKVILYDKTKKRFSTITIGNPNEEINHIFLLDDTHFCTISNSLNIQVTDLTNWTVKGKQTMEGSIEKIWQDEKRNVYAKLKSNNTAYEINAQSLSIQEKSANSLASSTTLADTMGVSWVAEPNAGIRKAVNFDNPIGVNSDKSTSHTNVFCEAKALFEDDARRLWMATEDGSLRLYDTEDKLIGFVNGKGDVGPNKMHFGNISVIYQGRTGKIWISTDKALLEVTEVEKNRFSIKKCQASEPGFQPLSNDFASILEDSKGHLWLASPDGGLHLLQQEENNCRFIHKENLLKFNYPPTVEKSHSLMEDKNGNIWLGSSEGLTIFSSDFSKPEEIRFFFYNTENTNLSNSCIYDIFQNEKGDIWLASFGGGLFRMKGEFVLFQTPEFEPFSRSNNRFPSDLLYNITDDAQDNLWILTEESIVKFNAETNASESFGQVQNFRCTGTSGKKLVRRHSGIISTATNAGYFSFNPQAIKPADYMPPIVFTRFLLFNKEPNIHEKDAVIPTSANYLEKITLKHNQSVFSISYAALDYRFPEHIQYAYKLEPFENEWNYVGNQRLATYTNLPKGEYTFLVKSTNSEGIWYDNIRELKIVVLPSFWETGWAYLIYALIIALIILASASIYRSKTKMKMEQEMSDSKLQFFTDISHELRTPLTLINGPLENVLENGTLRPEDRDQLEVVRTNTNRMLRMMNQIMDFRKIQSNKMRLRVEQTRLGEFIASCSTTFLKLAGNRQITFTVNDETNGATFWVDRDKIDTIIFNLLSNAFKFTPDGKAVSVRTYLDNGEGVIEVADKGCGMPKDKLSIIFERYTTLQNFSLTKQSGTGIGLSLVKEIVDLHKASVSVESEPNEGTTFSIRLKPGVDHFDNTVDIVINDETKNSETQEVKKNSQENNAQEMPKLLIVEDNEQLREFLRSVLGKRFLIVEAANGEQGLEASQRELPDFILTDIMMPVMDGMEMVRKVRANEQTSHIPIILLTAKTDMQSKIECLKIGANDYITKPFSMAYLEARIDNILAEREKWQERYKNNLISNRTFDAEEKEKGEETTPQEPLAPKDDAFMRSIVEIINKNMDNSEFSVEDLQDELKIGKWNLTSKVKALVGLTPMEFIRETRLSHAADLIDNSDYNMTQITYMIGMSDSRYFSRCFKQKYGVTPTEYKNRKK